MTISELGIEGAWVYTPKVFPDDRGSFHEWFRDADFRAQAGHRFGLGQANCSVSRRGVLRGIHYADLPPSQAKYVTCARGAVLDVVVDIRVGSPTYRRWEAVRIDEQNRRAVYVAEGLGHGFFALSDDATVLYLCSAPYSPEREHGIDPCDPDLAIDWPTDVAPLLSDKDAAAPSLAEAERRGLLPTYADWQAFDAALRSGA